MVTAGKFRHNTAIGAVHVDLRMDAMGKQPLLRIDEGSACFIAGGFNTKN
jgi:hypothetical protein